MTYFNLDELKADSFYKNLGLWAINFFEYTQSYNI